MSPGRLLNILSKDRVLEEGLHVRPVSPKLGHLKTRVFLLNERMSPTKNEERQQFTYS